MENKFFVPALFCIGLLANTFLICKAFAEPLTYENAPATPVICNINFSDKIPSCAITFRAKKGDIVKAEFFKHKNLPEYVDSLLPNPQNYEAEPEGFDLNPIASTYKVDGPKQFRLMYTGPREALDTSRGILGRLVITKKGANGQLDEAQNLPVYFTTGAGQNYSRITGKFVQFNGKNFLRVKNSGNGTLAIGKGIFDGKDVPMYANVMGNSTDTIALPNGFLPAKKTVVLIDKLNGKEVEVSIE